MAIESISGNDANLLAKLLKKPCPQGEIAIDPENQGKHLAFRNNLQFLLAIRKYGEEDKEAIHTWLFEHSAQFGEAFNKSIDPSKGGDALFFDGYPLIGDIPEEKLIKLESDIYGVSQEQAA